MIAKISIKKIYFVFLFLHLFLWTLAPSISNINLPLDTIEALAWGSDLEWGFNKHPPLSAVAVEIFYQIFGNQDWAYYLLSQIFVISTFYIIFKFANEFFNNIKLAVVATLLLEAIFYYNFTTPEFNVNIAQLPFWTLSVFLTWRCITRDKTIDYILLGLCFGLGILSKYLFLYLILSINLLLVYYIFKKKKINIKNFFLTGLVSLLVVTPHLFWLIENNFITLTYGLKRAGGLVHLIDHVKLPLYFVIKQLGILLPFFLLSIILLNKFKIKLILDEKKVFLIFVSLMPIFLIFLTSVILGSKIRTMWMTPFYLFFGILFIEFYKKNLNLKKIKKFYYAFLFIFFISPLLYLGISLSNDFKRTDYPGKEIARLVQERWNKNFYNEIKYVVGDEWFAGNLSYHLKSRPKWTNDFKNEALKLEINEGVIYTGNPKILKSICPGIYGTIKPVGYCMIGQR
ncbi:MAG: glycosyltransferase family 39 protein [Pseudomonadota bacterium]|nr:glycosyltransferase family 39 protein [Pseudomonadota bacterium]